MDTNKLILNLSAHALDLDGKPLAMRGPEKPASLASFLAQALFAERAAPDPLKFHAWAISLHGSDKIEIDKSDVQMLKGWINGYKSLSAGLHGPIKSAILALEK